MAHDERTKAQALALLMLGNTPRYVARETGIPLTTIKRWQPEALAMWDDILTPEMRTAVNELAALFPGLLQQNGPRKKAERAFGNWFKAF